MHQVRLDERRINVNLEPIFLSDLFLQHFAEPSTAPSLAAS